MSASTSLFAAGSPAGGDAASGLYRSAPYQHGAAADTLLPVGPTLGVVLGALLLCAAGVAAVVRLAGEDGRGFAREILSAGLRATLQLAAVSYLIGWVIGAVPALLGFVGLMYAVAFRTAGRRLTPNRTWWWAAVPIGAGALPVIALLLLTGLVPVSGIALVPVCGILIGGALTATVLAGRRALEELHTRSGEVEAGLALGLLEREARLEIARTSAAGALVPLLDQTRTVGLVTLPGAFVGMLLGGASPVAAGAVQLFILIALLMVQVITIAVVLELIARGRLHRDAEPGPGRTVPSWGRLRWSQQKGSSSSPDRRHTA